MSPNSGYLKLAISFSLLAILLLGLLPLFGQYNEREILNQQANQLIAQRQYAQAEQLFKVILDKYPGDLNSILQLLNIYFSLSQTDKAEELLNQYQRQIPETTYSEQRIQLLVMQAKVNEAWQASQSFLDLYGHDEFKYRRLASFFERKAFYDKVLELYQQARTKLKNPELFRLEIANTSMNYRQFSTAVYEYLAFLMKNPVNLFFTNNQLKTILQEDSTQIAIIAAIADSSSNQAIKEAYASALLTQRDYTTALQIYKQLDTQKMSRFADEQAAAGNAIIAFQAYAYLDSVETDALRKVDLRYRMAGIKYQEADYQTTLAIVDSTLSFPLWKDRSLSNRTGIGVKLRKLRSELSLALGEPADSAMKWLEDAKNFGRDQLERQEMDLEIARLKIMSNNRSRAQEILRTISQPKLQEGKEYLEFFSSLLAGEQNLADSLMNTFVIRYPGSVYTNDAIYLMMLSLGLKPADLPSFYSAIRLLQLNRKAGLDTLEMVISHNEDEELRLLAAEWAIGLSEFQRAKAILEHDFTDTIASEYASLLKLALVENKAEEQFLAREFLKNKPNSIFSPGFRQIISRLSNNRPNL